MAIGERQGLSGDAEQGLGHRRLVKLRSGLIPPAVEVTFERLAELMA